MIRRVFDAHTDTLMRISSGKEYLEGNSRTHFDMPRAVSAGVEHVVTAVCAEAERDQMDAFRRGVSMYSALKGSSKVEMLLMLEGCQPLERAEDRNEVMKMLSAASLTWNGENSLAGGIGCDSGLTARGRALARELDGRGIVLDVSHLCDRSRRELLSMDVMVAATHCNCRSIHDSPRNIPDDELREIAARGGAVGITFVREFIGGDASIDDIIRHLEHLVETAGARSAGFGSDFDGTARLPEGVAGCTVWPDIFESLEKRGWADGDIDLVAGGSWRRVFSRN